jgi:hypothetical protein
MEAIEKVYKEVTDKNKEDWTCNKDLMSWLTALAKK